MESCESEKNKGENGRNTKTRGISTVVCFDNILIQEIFRIVFFRETR